MNKLDKALSALDKKVDNIDFMKNFFKRYFSIVSTVTFALFVVLFIFRVFYTRPNLVAAIIEDDIKLISLALEKIDARCDILSIDKESSEIDFLNVSQFHGSQVGPLNLAHPKNWEGPYLHVNPIYQGQFYRIIKTAEGFFVVPGDGARLPNGLVVGKDFRITQWTRVSDLIKEGGPLTYEKKKLATKLIFKVGDWKRWHLREKTVKTLDRVVREFNEAMPFTKNDYEVEELKPGEPEEEILYG